VKARYRSFVAFLFSACLYAQQTGSLKDEATSQAQAAIPDKYISIPVAIMFGIGILIVLVKLRRQHVRKLAQRHAHRKGVQRIRRRFRSAA
jgi:hypothetical protein